jgi:rhodanese-related sulfurtransferase
MTVSSLVLDYPTGLPEHALEYLRGKLAFYADAADLAHDLEQGVPGIAVVDARTVEAYRAGHIPGALSLPHRTMDAQSTAHLDRGLVYVVYCDGIGCNASTKGAYRLASLGFRVKELIGGLDWWKRDGYAVAAGAEQGRLGVSSQECGC